MDGGIRIGTGLRTWPRRRWVAAAVAFPVLAVVFAVLGGGLATTASAWWIWPWLILTSALASVVLASYLARPGTGKAIEVGCSPCAAAAGVALVAALMAHAAAPASPFMAVVATGLTAFALRQRLTDASSCPAPARPAADAMPRIADPDVPPAREEPATPTGSGRRASRANRP